MQASPTKDANMLQDPKSSTVGVQLSIDARAATWAAVDLKVALFGKPAHAHSLTAATIPLLRTLSDKFDLVSPVSIYKKCFTLAQVTNGLVAAEHDQGAEQGIQNQRTYVQLGRKVSICVFCSGHTRMAPKGACTCTYTHTHTRHALKW